MDHGRLNPDDLVATLAEKESLLCEKDGVIALQQEQIAAQQVALDQAREQLALLKKALFGPRRERYAPSPDQQLLFGTLPLETTPSEAQAAESAAENPTPKTRRKPRRQFVIPDFLPVRRKDHRLPDEQLPCGCCGGERVVIATRVTKQIELEPAQAYVVEHVRYTYACSGCRAGDQVVTAGKPQKVNSRDKHGVSKTWDSGDLVPIYGLRSHLWESGNNRTNDDLKGFPAAMSEPLARDLVRSFSKAGDLVLDPFSGSGTTAKMAMLEHRDYLGFEVWDEHYHNSLKRLQRAKKEYQQKLDRILACSESEHEEKRA